MITLVRMILIGLAILASPVYALWALGGRIADKRAQAKVKKI
jgi:hypothetical protein